MGTFSMTEALHGPGEGSSASDPGEGTILGGRYEVVALLGRGAEGLVIEAFDMRASAKVALKLIPERDVVPARLARLRRELALARRITHPAVVRTHDLVDLGAWVGLAMELVVGVSLRELLEADREPKDAEWLLALAFGLAEGLASAHAAGVVHRDLKPSNILIEGSTRSARTPPTPKITDFGIARIGEDAPDSARPLAGDGQGVDLGQPTATGQLVGTPLYMAPEQLDGTPAAPPADVYAFGLVIYEAATGEVPLCAPDAAALRTLRAGAAPPLKVRRPDLSKAFCDVVDGCLRPRPEDRFKDAAAVAAALRSVTPGGARTQRAFPHRASIAVAAIAGLTAAIAFLRPPGQRSEAEPVAGDTITFEKSPHVVGQRTRMRERQTRTMVYSKPVGRLVTTRDSTDRTVTVLAAHDTTLLKVRVRYDEAVQTEDAAGTVSHKRSPLDGNTYIAEWVRDRLVVTNEQYEPVSPEEEEKLTAVSRSIGQPSVELAALPDLPLQVGDRADSLAELFRGSLARGKALDLDEVDARLTSIQRLDGEDLGRFSLVLSGSARDSDLSVRMDVTGSLGVRRSGRFRDVALLGLIRIEGPDVAALGTLLLDTQHEVVDQ